MPARAQDTFNAMLRDQIAPRLRALGFTGSGHQYVWPAAEHWASLGFQKSRRGTGTELEFTVNVSVVGRAA